MTDKIRSNIHRAPARKIWQCEYKWGRQRGQSTTLNVTRTDGGGLSIVFGRGSIDINGELVEAFARMVAEAAAWTDKEGDTRC